MRDSDAGPTDIKASSSTRAAASASFTCSILCGVERGPITPPLGSSLLSSSRRCRCSVGTGPHWTLCGHRPPGPPGGWEYVVPSPLPYNSTWRAWLTHPPPPYSMPILLPAGDSGLPHGRDTARTATPCPSLHAG